MDLPRVRTHHTCPGAILIFVTCPYSFTAHWRRLCSDVHKSFACALFRIECYSGLSKARKNLNDINTPGTKIKAHPDFPWEGPITQNYRHSLGSKPASGWEPPPEYLGGLLSKKLQFSSLFLGSRPILLGLLPV